MAAFDHNGPAARALVEGQHPSLADCVAAVEEPLAAAAEVVPDESPDTAMAAFDHTSLDSPAAAAVADGNQPPNLQDIALAVEPSVLPASLDESVGEDEEPDVALAAFDHMVPEPAATAATTAAAEEGAAAYDQAFLDPLQHSALDGSVASGSVDLADAEVVVLKTPAATAAAAVPAKEAVAAGSAAAGTGKGQAAREAQQGDLGAMVQRWWASVMQMFEDWQRNLSGGPK
jgi:hypothetical protein